MEASVNSVVSLLCTGAMLALLGAAIVLVNTLTSRRDLQVGRDRNNVRLNPVLRRVPWFAAATIASTITPLYAVLTVFGLRESQFGLLVLASPIALVLAAFIARALSRQLLDENPVIARGVLGTGLVASLFADRDRHLPSSLVRLVGLGNVMAIIWLEVKYLSVYFAQYLHPDRDSEYTLTAALLSAILVAVLCAFVTRFRMNGVIVSDCIYWPLTVVSVLLLAVWLVWEIAASRGAAGLAGQLLQVPLAHAPAVSLLTMSGFVLNLLVVNVAILSLRDEHWIRVAAFAESGDGRRNLMLDMLPSACMNAAALWFVIIVIGQLLFPLHPEAQQVAGNWFPVLLAMKSTAPALFSLLIMGICAVALSTMDSQFFAFRQLASYDVAADNVKVARRSTASHLLIAVGCGVLTFLVVYVALEMEVNDFAVVLLLYPLPVVLLPGVAKLVLTGNRPMRFDVLVPLVTYMLLAGAAIAPYLYGREPSLTLLVWIAPLATVVGAVYSLLLRRPDPVGSTGEVQQT